MNAAANMPAKLLRARSRLIMDQAFFGALIMGMTPVEKPESECPTMATDGRSLYYSRAFVESMTEAECIFVCAHEVMHCASIHHARRGKRNPRLWNIAADYAINQELVAAKIGTMPKIGLIDSKYNGMGAEKIYSLLLQEIEQESKKQKQQGNGAGDGGDESDDSDSGNDSGDDTGPGNASGKPGKPGKGKGGQGRDKFGDLSNPDPGGCGGVIDAAPEHDTGALSEAAADMESKVRQAIAIAKAQGAGTIPGYLQRLIGELNAPRIDWRAELRRFITSTVKNNYAWDKPNRRFAHSGLTLPGFVPDRPAHIVAIVDTSGSIGNADLKAFVSELQGILDAGATDRLTIGYADTEIKREDSFLAGDLIMTPDVRTLGGGGTCFRQPMQWRAENHADATAILYLTDLETSDYGDEPECPHLWVIKNSHADIPALVARAPFGESIILEHD